MAIPGVRTLSTESDKIKEVVLYLLVKESLWIT